MFKECVKRMKTTAPSWHTNTGLVLSSEYEAKCVHNFLTLQELQNVPESACEVACLSHNANYNRFKNIRPCEYDSTSVRHRNNFIVLYIYTDDNSRVCLAEISGEEGSDYINASFITVSTTVFTAF